MVKDPPMKNLLGIDTSSEKCIVAGCTANGAFAERISNESQTHNEDLLPHIESVLNELGISVHDLDGIVLGIGPGSFTGLRIGLALVKGIIAGVQQTIEVYPVSSLLVFATPELVGGRTVLALADARRQEFFSAAYQISSTGIVAVLPEKIRPPKIIQAWIEAQSAVSDVFVAGPGKQLFLASDSEEIEVYKSVGRSLLDLVNTKMTALQGISGERVDALEPSYIRSVAARTIAQRAQIGS
jgi:tRNA threonylcarbamoyladenosine biosynthesis protein TsaB